MITPLGLCFLLIEPNRNAGGERVVRSAQMVASHPICACKSAAMRLDERMFPYIASSQDKTWQPGPYEGVELIILHKHESTGGVVVLRKFQAGHTIPAHTHPVANEWAYVLSGEWEESGATYTQGTLFHAPKGVRHGPHVARTEVISLTIFDGPLTVV